MKTIAVINQKGGVAKSTTASALGAGLSNKGYRVLFVDLDAQGNLTYNMGADGSAPTVREVLLNQATVEETIKHTNSGDLISSNPLLAGADMEITATGKEYRLKKALQNVSVLYDYCVIDTPPALGILTVNALTACEWAIIPAQADMYSLQGIGQLYKTIDLVKEYCNPDLQVKGIVLTRYNGRAVISRDVADMLEKTAQQLNTKLYRTRIRECTAVKESQVKRMDIFTYAPTSNASEDYGNLIKEILEEK